MDEKQAMLEIEIFYSNNNKIELVNFDNEDELHEKISLMK